jgi:hypothetical protein
MRTYKRILGAVGVVVGAVVLVQSPANAATGSLTLENPAGTRVVYLNPPPGCYTTDRAFSTVINHTNVYVVVYQGLHCSGADQVVDPGSPPVDVGPRYSVRVTA